LVELLLYFQGTDNDGLDHRWLMKCQTCSKAAVFHVTELRQGEFGERHLCEECMEKVDAMADPPVKPPRFLPANLSALSDPAALPRMAAYLIPPLCLALKDECAGVRCLAARHLGMLGKEGQPALEALRSAANDPEDDVRAMMAVAIEIIERTRATK
jgi:hypothetical protein